MAHAEIVDALGDVLVRFGSLYEWASETPQPRALRGRAPVYVATLPASDWIVAVRHAWHGGLLAPLTRDLWVAPSRAPGELAKSVSLQKANIPSAPVVGYALTPAAPGVVRVDVVSRFLDNTYDLGAVLSGLAPKLEVGASLEAARRLLVLLATHQLVHPDLNVKNVLVRQQGGSTTALVIDVDIMQWRRDWTVERVMRANTARVIRSVEKWRRQFAIPLDADQVSNYRRLLLESTPLPTPVALEDWP